MNRREYMLKELTELSTYLTDRIKVKWKRPWFTKPVVPIVYDSNGKVYAPRDTSGRLEINIQAVDKNTVNGVNATVGVNQAGNIGVVSGGDNGFRLEAVIYIEVSAATPALTLVSGDESITQTFTATANVRNDLFGLSGARPRVQTGDTLSVLNGAAGDTWSLTGTPIGSAALPVSG